MSVIDGQLSKFRGGRRGFFGDDAATSLPPSGAAGGALAGTYPNPTLAAGSMAQLDDQATPVYPTDVANEGVWYGTFTKSQALLCNDGTNTVIGNFAILDSTAGHTGQTVVGSNANSLGAGCTAYGYNAGANTNGVAVGINAAAGNAVQGPIAIGSSAVASGSGSVALGSNSLAAHSQAVCLGRGTTSAKANDICLGTGTVADAAGPSLNLNVQIADVTVAAAGASDVYMLVRINGTNYKLLLHT